MESPLYTKIAVTLHENAECEITGEIPEATVLGYRPKILKELGKDIKLDGNTLVSKTFFMKRPRRFYRRPTHS